MDLALNNPRKTNMPLKSKQTTLLFTNTRGGTGVFMSFLGESKKNHLEFELRSLVLFSSTITLILSATLKLSKDNSIRLEYVSKVYSLNKTNQLFHVKIEKKL